MDQVDRLYRMKLDPEATLTASARAITQVTQAATAHPPKVILVFECLGRYMYLLNQMDQLFQNIRGATDAEIVGFFCAAEQGIMEGVPCQTHNYTTSLLGIG